jgi:general nucleoside transport system ATP-binding protein
MTEAISVKYICKEFPGVKANQDINLSINQGEIRAIVGENGAGKTTLMNILYGLYQPDHGSIFIKGKEVKLHNSRVAMAMGIGMVHQHFKLVPSFTLGQNIVLGIEPKKMGFVDNKQIEKNVNELSEKYGLPIEVNNLAVNASVGEQQRAELLKALYRGADILILDEPTAVLTDMETEELFIMLRRLADQGKTILFISHKLREVLAVSDTTTVMRMGKVVGTVKTSETDSCQLAGMMIGRDTVGGRMRQKDVHPGDVVLEMKNVCVRDERNLLSVRHVNLKLHSSEVLGVAGVDGNGQEELIEAIMGLRPVLSGEITVYNKNTTHTSTREIRESGVAYIPSDRYKSGVAVEAHVWENLIASDYYKSPVSGFLGFQVKEIEQIAQKLIKNFQIITSSSKTQTGNLSGGNIQRLIVGRELGSNRAMAVIASQPTRGIDISGTEAIRRTLLDYANRGAGVLLVSADLDEVLALSDRVVVLYEGELFDAGIVDDEIRTRVGNLMTGINEGCIT